MSSNLQKFIDEIQARVFAQEAILQSIIARLQADNGDWNSLLDAIEQQSLHSLSSRGADYQQHGSPVVKEFFQSLRKWKKSQPILTHDSGSVQ